MRINRNEARRKAKQNAQRNGTSVQHEMTIIESDYDVYDHTSGGGYEESSTGGYSADTGSSGSSGSCDTGSSGSYGE